MYIGNTPAENYASFLTETFTVSATASYTLSHAVANENDIRLVINGVVQQPGSGKAYTASGTTLTLSSATASGDVMYAVYLGRALQTVNPPNASVGSAQVADSLISGKTALGATPADTDELLISDAGTLKRVDYSYLKSANTPSFLANRSGSDQSITNNTNTTVIFDNEVIDTDSGYDTSTGIYTVPSGKGGKYFICAAPTLTATGGATIYRTLITKNGTSTVVARGDIRLDYASGFGENTPACSAILDLSAGDTLRVLARFEGQNGGALSISNSSSGAHSQFFGYKLI